MMDQNRPDPGPDPDPPDPPGPSPDPPVPGQFNPWLISPGESILSSEYFIDIDYSGLSHIPYRRYWGMYPNQYYPTLPYYSTLPNCTGYAWGRLLYMSNGVQPSIGPFDAYRWIYNTSWPVSQTPTLGAVACWIGGQYGHVAIVEYIHYDSGGNWDYIQVSESGYYNRYYGGAWWDFGGCQLTTVYASNPGRWYGYRLAGFINTPSSYIVR